MRVTVLLENTACRDDVAFSHGLSLFIETARHRILFDAGPSDDFAANAAALGVDVSAADVAVLSHGHWDHGNGLPLFLTLNSAASVYARPGVFGDYFAAGADGGRYIGIPKSLAEHKDRFVMAAPRHEIDSGLLLFTAADGTFPRPSGDRFLLKADGSEDDFAHEHSLLVTENGRTVLFAGCAHSGIVNIIRAACDIQGRAPDVVFAGFHLMETADGSAEPEEYLASLADGLAAFPCRYYTGHCTGATAYASLSSRLGDRLTHIAGGAVYEF